MEGAGKRLFSAVCVVYGAVSEVLRAWVEPSCVSAPDKILPVLAVTLWSMLCPSSHCFHQHVVTTPIPQHFRGLARSDVN